MKRILTTLTILASAIVFSQGPIGIGTDTPQKTLHVEGDLQITKELNIGGNATTAGDPGTHGQFLISQGPGIAPMWATVNIAPLDPDSYKLSKVYLLQTLPNELTDTNRQTVLGEIKNITINSPNNIVITSLQATATILDPINGDAIVYSFSLYNGNTHIESAPYNYLMFANFTSVTQNFNYTYFTSNLTTGSHNFIIRANRMNSVGSAASKTLYLGQTRPSGPTLIPTPGVAIVYVYEK